MIGIILAAHGPLSKALLESSRMILGDLPQIVTVSLMPGEDLNGLKNRMNAKCEEVDSGDGVLILLDLFGGTPANAAAWVMQQRDKTNAITGVNLPMLVEILLNRDTHDQVELLAESAKTAGQDGIINILESFARFQKGEEK